MTKQKTKTGDIIWRQIGDEIVVIKDDGLAVHVLNKTAAHIWKMCQEGHSPEEIAADLCQHFEVELKEAITDTKDLLANLRKLGLLETSGVTK